MSKADEQDRELFRQQADRDILAVMRTPEGRRFVWHIVSHLAGAFGDAFTGETTHITASILGRQKLGKDLMAEVQRVAPAEWDQGYLEARLEERKRALAPPPPKDERVPD